MWPLYLVGTLWGVQLSLRKFEILLQLLLLATRMDLRVVNTTVMPETWMDCCCIENSVFTKLNYNILRYSPNTTLWD